MLRGRILWLVLSISVYNVVSQRTAEEWKSRVIYHLLTDRFSREGDTPAAPCTALRSWCGGNFRGISQRLEYIKNLGANAIWISPIVLNTPGGYHGYWAQNIYEIEPHWGTKEDLKALVAAAHAQDIWVMVDVVPNHMGYPPNCGEFNCAPGAEVDFSAFVPFNDSEHFHEICHPVDWNNQTQVENCRLANLPDLNQTVTYVRQTLLDWIADLTAEYGFDGYRVDTVKHIALEFWPEFQRAAGAYCLGEVWVEDSVEYVAKYQGPNGMDAVFNFPMVGALKRIWHEGKPMTLLDDNLKATKTHFLDPHSLGIFVDNHDVQRFLNITSDLAQFKNALTLVTYGVGIPLIYYGSEQGFSGGRDPDCRESLWPHYDQQSEMYLFIKQGFDVRREMLVDIIGSEQETLHVDANSYIFSRAQHKIFAAITNIGRSNVTKDFAFTHMVDGTKYQNIRDLNDVVTVSNGRLVVNLINGDPKVYKICNDPESTLPPNGSTRHVSSMFAVFLLPLISISFLS